MYQYRKLTAKQQEEIVEQRQREARPWHRLPHLYQENQTFMLTGTCFEHQALMEDFARRDEFAQLLVEMMENIEAELFAWCVLPNHYHLLARCDLSRFAPSVGRLHGSASHRWNGQDNRRGRTVWYSYSDRVIRSERHFYVSFNYIHANPVKHGYVSRVTQWKQSSVHHFVAEWGQDALRELWRDYPVRDYGRNWDWTA